MSVLARDSMRKLGEVADYVNGRGFSKNEWGDSGRPIIRIQNLTGSKNVVNRTSKSYDSKYAVSDGDLLFAWSATLGAYIWHGEGAWLNQHIYKVLPRDNVDKKYLYYCLTEAIDRLMTITHGSGMVHLTMQVFKNFEVFMPDIQEQRRIVDCIERLFRKLDDAAELVQSVIDESKNRKAVILRQVYSGELAQLRTGDGNSNNRSWKTARLSEICHSLRYGTSAKSEKEGKIPVIRMGNLQDGEIMWDDLVYSNNDDEIAKYQLKEGDVLFNRTNSAALVGKTAIYRGERPAIYASYLIKLDYNRRVINGEFLNYILNSPQKEEYCNRVKSDSVNQSNINAKKIGAFEVPVPDLKVQEELVERLNAIFKQERVVVSQAEKTLECIANTRQAILTLAFRGKLSTNDPFEY